MDKKKNLYKHSFYNAVGDGPSRAIVQDINGDYFNVVGHSSDIELQLISDKEMEEISGDALEMNEEEVFSMFTEGEVESINDLIEDPRPAK